MVGSSRQDEFERKRKGPDVIVLVIRTCGALSWILLIAGLWLLDQARPQKANLLDKRWDFQVRERWDEDTLWIVLIVALVNLVICGGGLIANSRRRRRDDDRYSRSLLINGVISVLAILIYWRLA